MIFNGILVSNSNMERARDKAWWYIPKDYKTALSALEDRLNDLAYSNAGLSRVEAVKLLQSNLSKKDSKNAEEILDLFIDFYQNSNEVLKLVKDESDKDKDTISFKIKCELVGTYTDDFANARIILERILENRTECVGKAALHLAMKNLIEPEYVPGKTKNSYRPDQSDIEADLEERYKDKFKVAINLLLKAKLVELESDHRKRKNASHKEGRVRKSYKLTQNILELSSDEGSDNVYDRAISRLRNIRLKAKAKGNTATKKKEINKILAAQDYISNSLKSLPIESCTDRTVYHWFSVFLIMKYAHVDTSRILDDIITYIRYNNIKFTPVPVTERKLSQWEESYACWSAFEVLLVKETSINVKWAIAISEDEYIDATYRLIQDLTEVILTFDAYERSKAKTDTHNTDNEIGWIKDRRYSLLYVRATIEMNSSHHDAIGHIENLFKNVLSIHDEINLYDLCLVVTKLSRLSCEDAFEYASKARKWIFVITNIPGYDKDYDAQNVLINIYLHLIGMSEDDDRCEKYRNKCVALIKSLKPDTKNINHIYERITQKYLYLLYSIDSLRYPDVIRRISDLWNDIKEASDLADKQDPRIYIFKYDTFILAAQYLNAYLDFGYSLAILASQAIIHLKRLGVKEQMAYYYPLEALGEFVKDFEPDVALRVKIQIQPNYPNKLYINRDIAILLFDKGCLTSALTYAKQAENFFEQSNFDDLESRAYYLDVHLIQIKALYLLGESERAERILSNCRVQLRKLEDLYEPLDRNCILQGVINHCAEIDAEIQKRPFYARELRLDYLLVAISHMEDKSSDIEAFYDKWKQFNGMYMYHRECIEESLIEEFESAGFPDYLENIAENVEFTSPNVDLSPLEDYEIEQLYDNLVQSYQHYQRKILLNDNEEKFTDPDVPLELPTYDLLFELLQSQKHSSALISQVCHNDESRNDVIIANLEKYHYIVMNDSSSLDETLQAIDLFMDSLNSFSTTSVPVYAREMAAEVLCIKSDLMGDEKCDAQEEILYEAESFVLDSKHEFISKKAIEIYISIERRLYDMYDYQCRSGLPESLMVEGALDLIETYDIKSVDAARFLGDRAEYFAFNKNDKPVAKNYFEQAIDILQNIDPPTDDSRHFLELYKEFLAEL